MPHSDFSHRPARTWTKVAITVPSSHADTVAAYMASISGSGIEQIELPQEGPGAGMEQIVAYLDDTQAADQLFNTLNAYLRDLNKTLTDHPPASVHHERISEEDWNRRWKEHFKPFRLTNRLVIKPSWEEYQPQGDELVLEMDPGMAFGTGLHASTKLALSLIEESFAAQPAATVLDVGTGTGILGMDCALLGATRVIGVDNDIDARTAASENVCKNHLEQTMAIAPGSLEEISGCFDMVIANITLDVLTLLAQDLVCRLRAGGRLVLSGILTDTQAEAIITLYTALGLELVSSKSQDEWTALLLAKK